MYQLAWLLRIFVLAIKSQTTLFKIGAKQRLRFRFGIHRNYWQSVPRRIGRQKTGNDGPAVGCGRYVLECDLHRQVFLDEDVIARLRHKFGRIIFDKHGRPALPAAVQIPFGDDDARRPVIERLDHLAFVKRRPFAYRTRKAIGTDGPSAFPLLEFQACAEPVGVVGHVKHSHIFDRPRLYSFARGPIHQNRQAAVNRSGQLGGAPVPVDRGSPCVRIYPADVFQ